MLYLLIALGFLFFAGVAMTINEGLWSNTILLLCVLISGLAGAIVGVPAGVWMLEKSGKEDAFAWYFVFAGTWIVFSLVMAVLRFLTDKASKVRVRFLPVVDKVGGWAMGVLVATMLEGFAAFTLSSGPVREGEWKIGVDDPKLSQMEKAATPFYSVLKPFVKAEEIDSEYFDF